MRKPSYSMTSSDNFLQSVFIHGICDEPSSLAGVIKGMDVSWPGACILDRTSAGRVSSTLCTNR